MVIPALFLVATPAMAKPDRPSASAMPELGKLLETAGWEMTPDMSGAYRVGDLYDRVSNQRVAQASECFDAEVTESPYTSMEVTRSLEAGVRMNVVVAGVRAGMGVTKKITFDDPSHHQVSRLQLTPKPACEEAINKQRAGGADTTGWFIITEVISAMIQKQECGNYDAKAGYFTLSGEVDIQAACLQTSLEPVAIAYKTLPVNDIIPHMSTLRARDVSYGGRGVALTGCPWGKIKRASAGMMWLKINGQILDVRGKTARFKIMEDLSKCGHARAGDSFMRWRGARRITNIAAATMYGGMLVSPFSAMAAGAKREAMLRELNRR